MWETKFAIRPSIRNNKQFKRDEVIKTVAAAVGPGHKVDLKDYDLLIIVEIYQVRDDCGGAEILTAAYSDRISLV